MRELIAADGRDPRTRAAIRFFVDGGRNDPHQMTQGLTLAALIEALARLPPSDWSGRLVLDLIDGLQSDESPLDAAAHGNRDQLAHWTRPMEGRLAEC